MAKKNVIRLIVFILICALLFIYLNQVFTISDTDENSQIINSFYAEPENSLDGVYLGSSATNRFWNGSRAYDKYGFAIFGLATFSQPLVLYQCLIEEIEKSQNPKLYILELRDATESADDITEEGIRRVTDNLQHSLTWIKAINISLEYAQQGDNNVDTNKMNYYFTILKYHGRWNSNDFSSDDLFLKKTTDKTKGLVLGKNCFKQAVQEKGIYTDKTRKLAPETEAILNNLLDYCDTLDAQVLFVLSPYLETDTVKLGRMNEAERIVKQRGYSVLNFNTEALFESVGFDLDRDYYDYKHVNLLGSEKFTDYLAQYIESHYKLQDHRRDSTYQSWCDAYEYYLDYVSDKRADMLD